MNNNFDFNPSEREQVMRQACEMGITTSDLLFELCKSKNWTNKNDIINGVNELFVKGVYFDVTDGHLVQVG